MTEPDQPIEPDGDKRLRDALRRERREKAELQSKLTDLERQLDAARSKLNRMANRRSVRLALRAAKLGAPVVAAIRRIRGKTEAPLAPVATQDEVAAEIRRLRPDPGPETGPSVTAIVLNRDGAPHLRRLLPALRDRTTYPSFELVVVDNGSTDESLQLLDQEWGFPLRTIRNEGNVSFSRGCNQGIAAAGGEYVLLLNNDITPINSGWLGELVNSLETHPDRGAAGSLLVYPERPGFVSKDPNTGADLTIQHRGIGFRWRRSAEPSATVPWAYNMDVGGDPTRPELTATEEVPAATAACLLVRSETLHRLGGLDEGFTYGMEDVDLCLRIRQAGLKVVLVGKAALFHHEFGTQSEVAAARKRSYGRANVQHFSEKWGPQLSRLLQLEALTPGARTLRHGDMPAIAITVTKDDPNAGWGDWYTAHELGDALAAAGYTITYAERFHDNWYQLSDEVGVVICLLDSYDVRNAPKDALTIAWVRNWTDRWIERPWFNSHDVYVPSSSQTSAILTAAGATVTEVVPLATNVERFYPRGVNAAYENDYAVTSNFWKAARPGIEEIIVRPGESFSIYGGGWEDVPRLSRYVRGQLPYDELPEVYSSVKIIIDETATPTLPYGAINSRVFDAAACGALVITNNAIGSEELFAGELPVYANAAQQRELLDKYLSDDDLRRSTAASLQEQVVKHHTYTHRAREIPAAVSTAVMRPRIALKIGSPDEESAPLWGDTHFATALADALRRQGARPEVHLLSDWETPASQCVDVAIHIRGLGSYVPKPAHTNLLWIISHPDEVTPEECNGYDRVLVASESHARELRDRISVPVEAMYQATDPERFYPDPDPQLATELLFVGNSRGQRRIAVDAALEIGAPLRVYGQDWGDTLPSNVLAGDHFPNDRLGSLYSSAGVTLNDHWPEMARQGFISNRVFDIIAAGGVVFTDPVAGLDAVFGDLVPTFDSPGELRELLDDWRSNRGRYNEQMAEARKIVLNRHTFEARAIRIIEIVSDLGWQPTAGLG